MKVEGKLARALEALYLFRMAPEDEKHYHRVRLNRVLDEVRGERFSRREVTDYLLATHYKEYMKRRLREERPEL